MHWVTGTSEGAKEGEGYLASTPFTLPRSGNPGVHTIQPRKRCETRPSRTASEHAPGGRVGSPAVVSIPVIAHVARALLANGIERIGAAGGAIRFMFEVAAFAKQVGEIGRASCRLVIFHGPLELRAVDVLAI